MSETVAPKNWNVNYKSCKLALVSVTAETRPNRRGTRSRDAVLDAAEGLMAEQGFEAATIAAVVKEAGIPASSIYHYFGSKEGLLLAVMERGTQRFFESLAEPTERLGPPPQHLGALVEATAATLEEQPDFLRLILVMATQAPTAGSRELSTMVERVREMALERLRPQMGLVFRIDASGADADHLARFALAAFDGAFIAHQARPDISLPDLLRYLPAALVAVRRELNRAGQV